MDEYVVPWYRTPIVWILVSFFVICLGVYISYDVTNISRSEHAIHCMKACYGRPFVAFYDAEEKSGSCSCLR
jgi:hypothetical protein